MAMSAAATFVMVSATMATAFTTVFAAMAVSAAASTTTSFPAHHIQHACYLFIGGGTGFYDTAFEMQSLTCPRVVQVYNHGLFLYLFYQSLET